MTRKRLALAALVAAVLAATLAGCQAPPPDPGWRCQVKHRYAK